MRKVTIEDISRETGLSRGTVSRALNNRPDISVETRQRVLEACTKLRYVPSHAARTLATGRNLTLAVFIDDLSSPLSASILRGVLGTTGPRGYFIHLVEMNERVPAVERIQQVPAERVDAALLVSSLESDAFELLKSMLEHRPLGLTAPVAGTAADVFEPDYREAGRVAGRLLLERGAKRIGYLERGSPGIDDRRRGVREILADSGASVQAVDVSRGISAEEHVGFDALVLDESALVLAAATSARNGSLPTMVGFGRIGWGAAFQPSLTIIDYAGEEIGRRLSHALLQRIEGDRDSAPQHVRVAPRIGESAPGMLN